MDTPHSPPAARLAYGVDEFAAEIGTSRTTIYRLMSDGRLRYRQLDGRRIILGDDADDFLAALPVGGTDS